MRIGLVGSSGGHLAHLMWMKPWWGEHERFWVTFDTPDAVDRLDGERVWWAHHPTNRNVPNLLRNARLAWSVLARERPDVVVSTGAAVAIPFFAVARMLSIRTVFIEVYDRVEVPSWTGRVVRWVADAVVIQWPEQRHAYPNGILLGPIR